MPAHFIPPHGGYENLQSYKRSLVVYDGTVRFCERWYPKHDRTISQMVQAARSGKQNIVEGSLASATSKQTEIHLMNVARSSLGELLEDYRDFLRLRHFDEWKKDDPKVIRLRTLNKNPNADYETFRKGIENEDPEIAANVMIGLIKVTTYLLDQLLHKLEKDFLNEGGLRERMTRARLDERSKQKQSGKRA